MWYFFLLLIFAGCATFAAIRVAQGVPNHGLSWVCAQERGILKVAMSLLQKVYDRNANFCLHLDYLVYYNVQCRVSQDFLLSCNFSIIPFAFLDRRSELTRWCICSEELSFSLSWAIFQFIINCFTRTRCTDANAFVFVTETPFPMQSPTIRMKIPSGVSSTGLVSLH